jgi:RNA polymerase sigma-70 factor (ECF subfamily)
MIGPELIQRCRSGDRKAQHELYALTAERLHRLVLRLAKHADEAFDIVQETYIRAFTRIAQFDGRSSFWTWLCRIAINEALLRQRRATARANRESVAGALAHHRTAPPVDSRIDVEAALAELPWADRALLMLRYQEGLSYQGIAEIMGCEAGTVGSRLTRARDRVRHGDGEGMHSPEHLIDVERGQGH